MKISNVRYDAFNSAMNALRFEDDLIVRLENTAPFMSNKIQLAVNWCACGAVDTATARKAAKEMEKMAKIADTLNGLDLELSNQTDETIISKETFEQACEAMMDCIRNGNVYLIKAFFVGMEG